MRPGAHNGAWGASVSEERLERDRIASVTFLHATLLRLWNEWSQ
jgi:hypothetical protein